MCHPLHPRRASRVIRRLILTALVAAPVYAQSTWFVDASFPGPGDGSAGNPFSEIQGAINAPTTLSGDTLLVFDGTYNERLRVLNKGLTIRAALGETNVTVSRINREGVPCLFVRGVPAPGLTVEGIRFSQDASNSSGGRGLDIETSFVQLINCQIEDLEVSQSSGTSGGGLRCGPASSVELSGCRIERCGAIEGGGIEFRGISLSLTSCVLRSNVAFTRGGAINSPGAPGPGVLLVDDCDFEENRARLGGAIDSEGPGAMIRSSTFLRNGDSGTNFAGGVRGRGEITGCDFRFNLGQQGAAVSGFFAITDSTFVGNGGSDSGFWAAAYLGFGAASSMTDCVIREHGGESNSAGRAPSAVINATLVRCLFEDNRITFVNLGGNRRNGGGAITDCDAFDCTFRRNSGVTPSPSSSEDDLAQGGAAQSCTLVDCVFEDNQAPLGGAIADCVATRCQFRGNVAEESAANTSSGVGGAAYSSELQNCTLVGNRALASSGGADGGSLANCIVAGNLPDQVSSTSQVSFSCVVGGAPGTGNIAADPRFWGPATGDFQLLTGSPCIDAGDPALMDPDGSRLDMGAIPFDANYRGAPMGFCASGPDSFGCTPSLEASSSATTQSLFRFEAVGMGNTNLTLPFLATRTQFVPYQNGNLCLAGSLRRGPFGTLTNAGLGCARSFRFTFTSSDLLGLGFVPGDQLYVQVLYRNPGSASGIGITGALETVFLP